MRNAFYFIFLLIASNNLIADNIRGPSIEVIRLSPENDTFFEFDIAYEELLSFIVEPEATSTMPDKIQLEIHPSSAMRQYSGTFALFFYNNLIPLPSGETRNYRGDLINYFVIPDKSRFFIELFPSSTPSKKNIIPGTELILPRDLGKSAFPLMLTMLPVMKGIPDTLLHEKNKIRITAFYPDSGFLSINVFEKGKTPDENILLDSSGYELYIDGKTHEIKNTEAFTSGIKKIRILKKGYIPYEQSVVINKNETNTLNVYLSRVNPVITILAPEEAEVFLDGNPAKTGIDINDVSPGEHTVIFRLGQYSLSRKFPVENGKRYTVNLLLDIDITEE